jgi:peptidyl-Lys metalloendopeptidase
MFRLLLIIIILAGTINAYAQTTPASTPVLSVTINTDERAFANGLPITFTLTNTSSQTVRVLRWGTPFEKGFNRNMFEVWQGDTRVPYTGRLVKRGEPQAEDFITLKPNETISQELDVADGYAVYDAGDYTISFNSILTIVKADNELTLHKFNADSPDEVFQLTMKSEVVTSHMYLDRVQFFAKQPPAFTSCSATQRNTLDEALTQSEILAEESSNALVSTSVQQRPNANRYSTWFGDYTSSRYNTVSNKFNKIHDVLANKQVTFDCFCDPAIFDPVTTFAYVNPGQPYRIHLCDVFWEINMLGVNSKAGTIIHETSHFNVVANTNDHQYGPADVQNLAETDPGLAIENADNYEFFAENTPALPMDNAQPLPPDNNTPQLSINQPITTQIGAGELLIYEVTGASRITLSNMTKDFDLIVKKDGVPSASDNDCMPFLLGTSDETCEVSNTSTYFVVIQSYDVDVTPSTGGGTFTLLAEGDIAQEDACTLNADGNANVDALTDGLLFIRHMFGSRGKSLIDDAVGSGCTRCTAPEIEAFLDQCTTSGVSDFDGNGEIDALTDGLLSIRYIFGIRGASLIDNSIGDGCTRCSAAEIETNLQEHMP